MDGPCFLQDVDSFLVTSVTNSPKSCRFFCWNWKVWGNQGTCGNDKELSNRYMSKLLGDHGAEKKTQKKQKLLFQGSLKLPIWEEWNMHYKCMVNLKDFAFNSALFGLVIYIIYIDVCIYIYIYIYIYILTPVFHSDLVVWNYSTTFFAHHFPLKPWTSTLGPKIYIDLWGCFVSIVSGRACFPDKIGFLHWDFHL